MKKLNIVAAEKKKTLKVKVYDTPDDFDIIYAITDGRGNYSLSNDNSIFWTGKLTGDEINKFEIHGNPKKLYKGKPQLSVAEVNGKLGIWDLAIFEKVGGPYNNMDNLLEEIYGEEDALGSKLKYLEFDK